VAAIYVKCSLVSVVVHPNRARLNVYVLPVRVLLSTPLVPSYGVKD
jgi:hypothetical protein